MTYVPAATAAMFAGSFNLGVFWRLGTDPALHLWMGTGDMPIGVPSLDDAGTVYTGAGKLIQIPDLELLINGIADRIDFAVSGVDAAFQAQLSASAPEVRGARCTVGIAALDERYQPKTQIIGLWSGTADYWTMEQKPAKGDQPSVRSISVSVGAGDTTRARPRLTSFTDAQQQIISPGDKFFSRVPRYTQDHLVAWPRF